MLGHTIEATAWMSRELLVSNSSMKSIASSWQKLTWNRLSRPKNREISKKINRRSVLRMTAAFSTSSMTYSRLLTNRSDQRSEVTRNAAYACTSSKLESNWECCHSAVISSMWSASIPGSVSRAVVLWIGRMSIAIYGEKCTHSSENTEDIHWYIKFFTFWN